MVTLHREKIVIRITSMRKLFTILLLLASVVANAADRFVQFKKTADTDWCLTSAGSKVNIVYDEADYEGVKIALKNLATDINKVTGVTPSLNAENGGATIIIGTLDHNSLVNRLVRQKKIDGNALKRKSEKFIITTANVDGQTALVIVGSDKRGTIYGIYELSQQIGVSPWYDWADAPIEKNSDIYINKGVYTDGEPAVKYRGIFLNDEAPALTGWVHEKYGRAFDRRFYARVFELILRLKGNFMWPAMWGEAFYVDDPENSKTADEMGIIMGTSHHEPMARAHQEWTRKKRGQWNFDTNQAELDTFWLAGVERMKHTEDVVTIGMRGNGDEPMGKNADVALLERVVARQRQLIEQATGKKASETPQVWALYKEVQEYYEKGMKVPDDVILLLCDDNWGNVRLLPEFGGKHHKGGYGMYYHVDYVGGPRNSKWINVSQIQRMWEQLKLTYDYGVDKLWILNVGDLKPMEFPIDFWFRMAWNPEAPLSPMGISHEGEKAALAGSATNGLQKLTLVDDYTLAFCRQQFGEKEAKEAARILNLQGKYVHRCTAEQLDMRTYSLETGEWAKVLADYKRLETDAFAQYMRLAPEYKDAYFQLILFPVRGMANLYDMYYAQATGDAERVKACFENDAKLTAEYHALGGGKWNHFGDQNHIGYRSWQEPRQQTMPEVRNPKVNPNANDLLGGYVFEEKNGVVAMEAEHFFEKTDAKEAKWTVVPDFGKTLSGVALMPYTKPAKGGNIKYKFKLGEKIADGQKVTVLLYLAPTFPFNGNRGQSIVVGLDDSEECINVNELTKWIRDGYHDQNYEWEKTRVNVQKIPFTLKKSADGTHVLTLSPQDPGVMIERIVLDCGGVRKTYLGEPESAYSLQ